MEVGEEAVLLLLDLTSEVAVAASLRDQAGEAGQAVVGVQSYEMEQIDREDLGVVVVGEEGAVRHRMRPV